MSRASNTSTKQAPAKPAPSIDEIKSLTESLFENPDLADDLTDEQLIAVRKYMSPYGTIIAADESYANVSIINWRDEFMKRFHMMALTGFMFRMLEEYTDKADIKRRRAELQPAIDAAAAVGDTAGREALEAAREVELAKRTQITKQIIGRFLARNFEYNPDRHVRAAGKGKADPEVRLETMATEAAAAAAKADASSDNSSGITAETVTDAARAIAANAREAIEIIDAARRLADRAGAVDEATILTRKLEAMRVAVKPLAGVTATASAADVLPALRHITPADTLYNYGRYITNNYSRLRQAYNALYNEQIDIEASVIYYDSFPTADAARDHRIQHADEFKTEVITVSNNGITMLGPFKENVERIDFYNKNTEIMKRMMEQMEQDHKLGKDLMEKKVRRKKAAAVRKDGPDAPGLAAYARTAGAASEMASRPASDKDTDGTSTDEVKDESSANDKKPEDDPELPDDAVEVEVFYPSADGKELRKTKFYTQAEAPLHMKNNSDFAESYQPTREPGEPVRRVIKSRTGDLRSI